MPVNSVRDFKNIMVRMGTEYVRKMDRLCEVNKRKRRELLELLIDEAFVELELNPDARITPL